MVIVYVWAALMAALCAKPMIQGVHPTPELRREVGYVSPLTGRANQCWAATIDDQAGR